VYKFRSGFNNDCIDVFRNKIFHVLIPLTHELLFFFAVILLDSFVLSHLLDVLFVYLGNTWSSRSASISLSTCNTCKVLLIGLLIVLGVRKCK